MNDEQQTEAPDAKVARIELRAKSLTDEHVKELQEFYEELQRKQGFKLNVTQEVSEETETYIQVDLYNKDDAALDGFMFPYKE